MFCPNCGTKLEENALCCPFCGTAVPPEKPVQQADSLFPDPTVIPQETPEVDPSTLVEDLAPKEVEQTATFDQQPPVYPTQNPYPSQNPYPAPNAFGQDNQGFPTVQNPQNIPPYQNIVPIEIPKRSNIPMGILGAILFSLIACVIWVIIGTLGFISYIGGLAMGFCCVIGYKTLGKKFDIYGVITCIVVILVAVLACNIFVEVMSIFNDADAADIARQLGYNGFADVYFHFFEFMGTVDYALTYVGETQTLTSMFVRDLLISYVFSGIAFAVVAIPAFKARNNLPGANR